MDLWLTCINSKGLKSLKYGQEYQVIDIDPFNGVVLVINDNDEKVWYSESRFGAKRKEDNNMKRKYLPLSVDINVEGNLVYAGKTFIDENIPEVASMNKFLGTVSPFGLDLQIVKNSKEICVNIIEKNPPKVNGLYESNEAALDFAVNAKRTIDFYNAILVTKEYETKFLYVIKFSPNGKEYYFRSEDNIKIGDTVICKSSIGEQYAKVSNVVTTSEEDWKTRAVCTIA